MKTNLFLNLCAIVALGLLASCKDDNVVDGGSVEGPDVFLEPYCSVEKFTPMSDPTEVYEDIEEEGSRSQLTLGQNGMDFKWEAGDFISVFGRDLEKEVCMEYNIKSFDNSGNASFSIGEFPMKANACYLAFGQKRKNIKDDRDNLTLDYSGQKQIGNKDTRHLGAYDYIAAAAVAANDGMINFHFKHVGATLSLIFEFPDAADAKGDWPVIQKYKDGEGNLHSPLGIEWKHIQLYTDDNDYLQPVRSMSLRTGLPAQGADGYTPAIDNIDMSADENRNAARFDLALRAHTDEECDHKENGKCECGVALITDNNKERLRAFMEVPPLNYSGTKRFIFRLTGYDKDNNNQVVNYYAIYDKSNPIQAGKAVQMTMKPLPTSDFDLKVKLHLDWHNKSVFNTSRAGADAGVGHIGDPGDKEGFVPPTFLYAWIFDGNQNNGNTLVYKKFYGPKDLENMWRQDLGDAFIYKGDFKFNFSIDARVEYCDVFVAASTTELGYWADGKSLSTYNALDQSSNTYITDRDNQIMGTIGSTTSSDIRALTYNLAVIDSVRNIWSTPYTTEEGAFSGRVYNGMNVNLFHVAAKVDFQWNSAYTINNFQLINVQTQGLKLFEPTENTNSYYLNKINNAGFDTTPSSSTDWAGDTPTGFNASNSLVEFYNKNFDFYQDITGLTPGETYMIAMQGFYRYGGDNTTDEAVTRKEAGTLPERTILYAVPTGTTDSVVVKLVDIFAGANGNGTTGYNTSLGYVPNSQADARSYFNKNLYANRLLITIPAGKTSIRIGLKNSAEESGKRSWTCFDNFKISQCCTYTPDMSQQYFGRKVFYIPQPGPIPDRMAVGDFALYKGYTLLYLDTNRLDAGGNVVEMTTPVPFNAQGCLPSWFRGNVVVQ